MKSINIEIPSLPENIRIVESFIDNAKDKYDLNDDIYGNIMIAVTESVNNAIMHGNKKQHTFISNHPAPLKPLHKSENHSKPLETT